jgi:SGNH hydrolase-like domain, acetyltransferase AlgX
LNVSSFEWTILRDPPRTYWLDVAWPLFGSYLADVCATAESVGAPTVVMAIPQMAQFDDDMLTRTMADFRFSEQEVDWNRPQQQLNALAERLDLPVLDLLPIFRARSDRANLYLRQDTHLTALGHQVAAQQLAEFLRRGGWLR